MTSSACITALWVTVTTTVAAMPVASGAASPPATGGAPSATASGAGGQPAPPPSIANDTGVVESGAPALPASEALRRRALAFSAFRTPATVSAESVGAYANGCLLGGVGLPPSGPGFEVLHVDRHRRFGHPALVAFVRKLAKEAQKAGLAPLLIGDLSQPRGGPTPYGHRSHQSGLDVDIGFSHPPFMKKRRLTAKEREEMQPPVVVDLKARKLTANYGPKVERLIELAARQPEVERVFVNPHVKAALCKKKLKDRAWLRVVRPWHAHHDHLHARLKCPPGSPNCEAQLAVAPGDGCDEVDRWLEDEERRLRQPPPPPPPIAEPRPPRPPPPLPPLPAACQALLDRADEPVAGRAARHPRAQRTP